MTTLKRFLRIDAPKALGRWDINYCVKKTGTKIDLANEDHCGTCAQYAVQKIAENKVQKAITDQSKPLA